MEHRGVIDRSTNYLMTQAPPTANEASSGRYNNNFKIHCYGEDQFHFADIRPRNRRDRGPALDTTLPPRAYYKKSLDGHTPTQQQLMELRRLWGSSGDRGQRDRDRYRGPNTLPRATQPLPPQRELAPSAWREPYAPPPTREQVDPPNPPQEDYIEMDQPSHSL
jgi:hypothetical protein